MESSSADVADVVAKSEQFSARGNFFLAFVERVRHEDCVNNLLNLLIVMNVANFRAITFNTTMLFSSAMALDDFWSFLS